MTSTNNVGGTPAVHPDPHGESALLLVESLIHGLIAAKALTPAGAIEIVDVAIEVKIAAADHRGDDPAAALRSAAALEAIAGSLRRGGQG